MKLKKVILIVESTTTSMNRAFSALKKRNRAKKYYGMDIICFPDFQSLGSVITGTRLELLNVIRQKKPKSIQELARLTDRDFKNVYQDVKLLDQFGLIYLASSGPRKSAAPVAKFSEIILAA